MAQGYDSDIELSVGLSLEDIIQQSNKISKEVSKVFDSIDSSKLTKGMKKLQATMSKTESQMSSIISDIEALSDKATSAARFEELGREAEETALQVQELQSKIEAIQTGKKDASSLKQLQDYQSQIDQLMAKGDELVAEMVEIKQAGNDTFTVADATKVQQFAYKLGDVLNAQRLNIEAFKGMEEQQQREAEAAAEAARLEQEHAEALQRIRDNAGQINPEIEESVNQLHNLATETQQIEERIAQLREAGVGETGYQEYDQLVARLQQIAEERQQANEQIAHYNQEQLNALNEQASEEERLRQIEEEREAAQERCVAILRGDLNPEVADMVDRYQEVGNQIRELEVELESMSQQGQGLGYTEYDNTVRQLEQLRHQYEELREGIDNYANSLSYESQERERLEAEVQQRIQSADIENQKMAEMSNEYEKLGRKLDAMREKQQQLREQGMGAGYAEFDRLTGAIARTEQEYERLGNEINRYNQRIVDSNTKTNTFGQRIKALGTQLGGVVRQGLQTAANGIQNLIGRLKQGATASAQMGSSFNDMLKKIISTGLQIAGLTALFSSLKSAITAGLNNLVQFNGGANSANASMSQLTSSLTYLRNAWGAAFEPILTYVAPALSRLISMVASAVNAIARLFAMLTGRSTVFQAKPVSQDYASSKSSGGGGGKRGKSAEEKYEEAQKKAQEKYEKKLADTQEKNAKKVAKAEEKQAKAAAKLAKEQEEANKQLGHYDKLNVITIEEEKELEDYTPELLEEPELEPVNLDDFLDAAGGAADAIADMFEEIPLELSDWMQRLKDAIAAGEWEEVGKLIAEKCNEGLKYVDDWINNVLLPEGVKWAERIAKIGNGFVEAFDWTLLGKTIGDGINAIAAILDEFITTFHWDTLGKKLGELGNSLATSINWNLIGKTIGDGLNAIATLFTNFYKSFDIERLGSRIGSGLKTAFETVDFDTVARAFADKWNILIDLIHGIVTTSGLWDSIGDKLSNFVNAWFDEIEWEKLADTVSTGINGVFSVLDKMITSTDFGRFGKELGDSLNKMISDIDWKNIAKTFSDAFSGLLDFLINIDWATLAINLGTALADLIAGVDWAGLAVKLVTLFYELIMAAIELLFGFLGELAAQIGEFFDDMGEEGAAGFFKGIAEGMKNAATWIKENMVDPVVKAVKQLLGIHSPSTVFSDIGKNIVEGLKQGIVNAWTALKTAIQNKIDDMKQQFETAWNNIKDKAFTLWDNIRDGVSNKVEAMRNAISTKLDSAKSTFKSWKEAIEQLFSNMKTAVTNTFTQMKTAVTNTFNAMWSTIKSIINNIIGGVERMVNSVIDAINGMIDAVKALPAVGDLAGLVIDNIPNITLPRLAQGAVIPPNREFMAVLGDQKSGTNIETPLDTMIEAFNRALDSRGGANNEPIVLQLDGEVIAQAVWDEEEKRYKQNSNYSPIYT